MFYFFHKLSLSPQRLDVKLLCFVTRGAPVYFIKNFLFGYDLNGKNLKIHSIPTSINFSETSFSQEHVFYLIPILNDFDGLRRFFGINCLSYASFTYLQCHIIIIL